MITDRKARSERLRKMRERIFSFEEIKDEDFTVPFSHTTTLQVCGILTNILNKNIEIPVPRVYPTYEGGVSAEWTIDKHIAIDIIFDMLNGTINGYATNVDNGDFIGLSLRTDKLNKSKKIANYIIKCIKNLSN